MNSLSWHCSSQTHRFCLPVWPYATPFLLLVCLLLIGCHCELQRSKTARLAAENVLHTNQSKEHSTSRLRNFTLSVLAGVQEILQRHKKTFDILRTVLRISLFCVFPIQMPILWSTSALVKYIWSVYNPKWSIQAYFKREYFKRSISCFWEGVLAVLRQLCCRLPAVISETVLILCAVISKADSIIRISVKLIALSAFKYLRNCQVSSGSYSTHVSVQIEC